jgi:hypothetical protein
MWKTHTEPQVSKKAMRSTEVRLYRDMTFTSVTAFFPQAYYPKLYQEATA